MPRRKTPVELAAWLGQLWREFKLRGSVQARTAIIEHYRYLIPRTRERIIPTVPIKIAAEDLDQEGYIALVKAVDHFDIRRKVKFESYAITMVRGAMLEYLRREDWVPRSVRTTQKLILRAEEAVALRTGVENVTMAAIAAQMKMSIDELYQLWAESNVLTVVSLDDVVGDSDHDDHDALVVLESVRCKDPEPYVLVLKEIRKSLIKRYIAWLPANQRTVVVLYYFEDYTLKEIAEQMDRSESRVHQLHARAVQLLSRHLTHFAGMLVSSLPIHEEVVVASHPDSDRPPPSLG